jgi:hypothetical protein
MAEIFLSYANEDRETAGKVAVLLESAGWTVWWDRHIPAGRTWRSVLEDALTDMRCMVVLWSRNSIDSHWVKEEAEEARELEKLLPVLIEPVKPPVGFRAIQAADLTDWDGSNDTEGSRQLIADLQSLLGAPLKNTERQTEPVRPEVESVGEAEPRVHPSDDHRLAETASTRAKRTRSPRKFPLAVNWQAVSAGGAAVFVLLGAFWLWPQGEKPAAPDPSTKTENESQPPAALSLMKLTISAPRNQLKSGEALGLRLEGEYSDGTKKEITDGIAWSSSDAKVASVDDNGQVKTFEAGTVKITGRYNGTESSAWTLAVEAPPPVAKAPEAIKVIGLKVSGARKEIVVRERITLQVRASYSDGSEKAAPPGVVWQSSDRNIASVNTRGELEALRAGQVEVRAQTAEVSSAPVLIRVAEAPKKLAVQTPQLKIPEAAFRPPEPVAKYPNPALPSQPAPEVLAQRVAPYLTRAKNYRVQGNYAAALAELDKARAIDPSRADIRQEIEQTQKACNAEKSLGYNVNC